MTGKGSREKGARFEWDIADKFRKAGFEKAKRGQVFNGEPDIIGVPGWHFELKAQKNTHVQEWWRQAVQDADKRKDGTPVVIFKWNYGKPMAMMTFDTFLTLIKEKKQ